MKELLKRTPIDPYLVAMTMMVALAALMPAQGFSKVVLDHLIHAVIALLFTLYGARIAPKAIWEGITHFRLQALVFATTYVVFPLIGIALLAALQNSLEHRLAIGLVFVCLLPSTVQSSIAFTSIARGNVPAALCCASISNLAGVLLTPILVAVLLGSEAGGISLLSLRNIALQILLPFVVGQCARPWIGNWLKQHKSKIMLFDRGTILLVIYSAFSAGVVAGIWSKITTQSLILVVLADLLMLGLALAFTILVARSLRFRVEDEIVLVFCGSKKSLASGLPMASILFPASMVGLTVLPLMIFHQLQLIVCAALARRYAQRAYASADRRRGAACSGKVIKLINHR